MHKKTLAAMTAVGLAAALAIPTIAFGNARLNPGGSLSYLQTSNTPYIAQLSAANEVPPLTTSGSGVAAFTFDFVTATDVQVCWDISYSGVTPTAVRLYSGGAGVVGTQVVPDVAIVPLGPTSATGCTPIDPALATQIMTTPANYYVNVVTTANVGGAIRGQLAKGPAPAGEAHLLPVPLRAYDSRDAAGAKITPNETRTIGLALGKDSTNASLVAVPPGATAAIVTLTVTETTGTGGFLKLYSAALTDPPATSSINWSGVNQNIAVSTQVAVDASGKVKVTGGANATHFVIDVIGYLF